MKKKTLGKLNRDFPGYNIRQINNHIYIRDYKSRIDANMDKNREEKELQTESFIEHIYYVIKDLIRMEIEVAFNNKKWEDVI
jgi:hypothetical protein